ncbi:hypothetical protein Pcinc_005925 [Petrolisthes cinctipes]|uniref:Uncharacterized protein n=1 Tax=Petrolisthes cinctipes TaxID=88211 RepID=A0AAE1GE72_PETCI|nr:hypothetical protein Pcinc_005925 [Petrolisthes cinctipes]
MIQDDESDAGDELSKKEVDLYIVESFMVSAAYTDKDELSKKEVDLYIVESFMVSAAYTDKFEYSQIAVDDLPVKGSEYLP